MAKFERIKTRVNEHGSDFDDNPEWRKGYVFESSDYNGIEAIGLTYAINEATGRIHSWNSIKKID